MNLPEFPTSNEIDWTDEEVTEYGKACYSQALEDAAKVCYETTKNHMAFSWVGTPGFHPESFTITQVSKICADAIKALGEKK